ncbi:MAG: hypothetical protein KDD04_07975, partial [Sinomicrobium sp.]|nr:hypothetical protein [Sinomicrobium sp.]
MNRNLMNILFPNRNTVTESHRSWKPVRFYRLCIKPALFLLLFFLPGCEKDDICLDGDTPHLIIRFYDKDDPETPKAVTSLRVTGEGLTTPLSTVNRVTTDSIAIPLRSLENSSVFSFISESADDNGGMETGNTDVITFEYNTHEVFVSRACGYVTRYGNLIVLVTADGDNW